jgi:hypothetical protein
MKKISLYRNLGVGACALILFAFGVVSLVGNNRANADIPESEQVQVNVQKYGFTCMYTSDKPMNELSLNMLRTIDYGQSHITCSTSNSTGYTETFITSGYDDEDKAALFGQNTSAMIPSIDATGPLTGKTAWAWTSEKDVIGIDFSPIEDRGIPNTVYYTQRPALGHSSYVTIGVADDDPDSLLPSDVYYNELEYTLVENP